MPNYNFNNNYQPPYTPTYYPKAQANQYYFVNGIEGAKSFQMSPNQNVLLMDSDNPICYMKVSNNVGQSNIRYFKIEEIDENKTKEIISTPHPTIEYALKSDIENINNRLEELTNLIKGSAKGEQ